MDLSARDSSAAFRFYCWPALHEYALKGVLFEKMIKGVGRYAVEVDNVDSEFFERVICFVRPQYACGSALDLHREAARVADDLTAEVEDAQHGTRHVLRVNSERPRPQPERRTGKYARQDIPEPTQKKKSDWLPLLLSAGGGAAAAILITTIF